MFRALFSFWIVATATFFLMHAVPGDPFIGDKVLPQEVIDSLYAHYGLDQPLWIQYLTFWKQLFSGSLGPSIVYPGRTVGDLIKEAFPISAWLGLQALLLAIPTGILLGTWAAMRRGQWQDHLAMFLSTLAVSIPSFILGSLLQFIFSVKLHLLPVARFETFAHSILPTLSLAALPIAFIARLIRSNMIEELGQDYVRTALAKGLPLFRVSIRHALRNALLPVIAYLGPLTSHILTGSFIIEKIFAIPGLGQWFVHSINGRDYPVILGLTLFYCSFLMICTTLADYAYRLIDPRIQESSCAPSL
jgi:oligopeptide transport system permease protein